ncbi:SoxR reducing system RseC family protein [Halothiobacillus sp.]|uniref:SoxR reducing system RseC family protein n=1 Tax=Halothiobacillus sp. TaxID=1891311 RepID=UPI0026180BFF|nr:SoxR reducing system RseC family protein [Halothiobacillus sp.]
MNRQPHDPSLLNQPTIGSVPYAEHRLAGLASNGSDTADIQEEGVVVAVTADGVWVETQRQSGCQSCSSRGGCGVGIMQKALNRRQHKVRVQTDQPVQVGDHVRLLLPATALVQASVLMYFLPLLGLILGAVAGQLLFASDAGSIGGAVVSFTAVLLFIARQQNGLSRSGRYAPRIERVLFKSA